MSKASRGFDPIELGKKIEKKVTRNGPEGQERLYFSDVRFGNYYGGSITADTFGCNLGCEFCWAEDNDEISHLGKEVKFFSSNAIAGELITNKTKNKKISKCFRISRGEPTLSKNHLLALIQELENHNHPILLETNGILLGNDKNFVEELSNNKNLHIRISLKGANAQKFSILTGAKEVFYDFQLKAIRYCLDEQVNFHPAIMLDFIETLEEFKDLETSLLDITDPDKREEKELLRKLEFERLFLYPRVKKRLDAKGIKYNLESTTFLTDNSIFIMKYLMGINMSEALLAQQLAALLAPFLPYLVEPTVALGKDAAAKKLGEKFVDSSWNIATRLWEKIWPQAEKEPDVATDLKEIALEADAARVETLLSWQLEKKLFPILSPEMLTEIRKVVTDSGSGNQTTIASSRSVAIGGNSFGNIFTGDIIDSQGSPDKK